MNKTRMRDALSGMQAAGIPARKAAIIVAVSTNESNNTFGIGRNSALIYPPDCFPSRQVVRLEDGRTTPNNAFTNDADISKYMRDEQLLTSSGQFKPEAVAYDSLDAPSWQMVRLFEFLLDRRKLAALQCYSIGPTQIYLRYSPALGAKNQIAKRFATFDELFGFYMARDVTALVGPWFDYLPTQVASYPLPSSRVAGEAGPSDAIETYLETYQTGKRDWSNATWGQYANTFHFSVQETWKIMNELNYK